MPDDLEAVRALRASAIEADEETGRGGPTDDTPPPPDETEDAFLPEGCPVVPLGVQGETIYYLDQLKQLRPLKAKDHGKSAVLSLFGCLSDLVFDYWPRRSQDKITGEWHVTGWRNEDASRLLMAEAARRGVWSAQDRVRGAGAWLGEDGELIWHLGDRVAIIPADADRPRRYVPAGLIDDMVYPAAPPSPAPHPDSKPGAGDEVFRLIQTWRWRRGDVDATLALGMVVAQMLGGALKWRPVAWITGGRGTGKSTLQELIKLLHGAGGLLQSADPTAAGIRQTLRHASLPVSLDEAEPEEGDNRTMAALVKLARMAASGSLALRGGSDHEAASFTLRSCVLFSSILVPPLLPQDRSRMAILELDELDRDAPAPKITQKTIGELGRRLRRQIADQWPRASDTIDLYRDALRKAGHSARGQDVFGTLLACADLALYDRVPDGDSLEAWGEKLAAETLAELMGDMSDERSALTHLLSTVVESPHDRRRNTIGRWICLAAGKFAGEGEPETANKLLTECGLKVVNEVGSQYLAVANQHQGLAKIFAGTQWGTRPGATGVWAQAFRRLPGAHEPLGANGKPKPLWFGVTARCVQFPIALCLPAGSETDAPAPSSLV